VRIDPELQAQLAASGTKRLTAWGTLAAPAGTKDVTAGDLRDLVTRVVKRCEAATGTRAESVRVFENLNSFAVDAPPDLIGALAQQPELLSLNATGKSGFTIEPEPTTPSEKAEVRRHNRSRRR
jgi:hypothetical protein